jgi:hypothetical protein
VSFSLSIYLSIYLSISLSPQTDHSSKQTSLSLSFSSKQAIESPLFSLFYEVRASDEIFFPTLLALLGCLQSDPSGATPIGPQVIPRRLTFVDWRGDVRPYTFTSTDDLLAAMHAKPPTLTDPVTQQPYWPIFARKVSLSASFVGYSDRLYLSVYETEMRDVLWRFFSLYFPSPSDESHSLSLSSSMTWLWQRWEEESQRVIGQSPMSVRAWFRGPDYQEVRDRERGRDRELDRYGPGDNTGVVGGLNDEEIERDGERVLKRSRPTVSDDYDWNGGGNSEQPTW